MSDNDGSAKTRQKSAPQFQGLLSARRNWAILTWSVVLVALLLAAWYLWLQRGTPSEPRTNIDTIPEEVEPRAKLVAHVTECSKITSRVDFVGGIMVNTGEDYLQMKGYVDNVGDLPVTLINVDTLWKNNEGTVLQMGSVYIAVNEVVAPGDHIEFVDTTKNYLAAKCGAKVRDWWIVDKLNRTQVKPDSSPDAH